MCSVPSMCSRIRPTARVASPRRSRLHQRRVLGVRVGQHLLGVGDQRDQVAHRALDLGHLDHEPGRARRLGDADVEADVGAAVVLEVLGLGHLLDQLVEPVEVARPPRARRRGSWRRSRPPPGARAPTTPPGRAARSRAPASGGASTTNVPPRATALGDQVPALRERRQRLAQRRARDPQLARELALGRQLAARREQSEPDRGAEPLDRLLERRRRPDRLKHRIQGSIARHRDNRSAQIPAMAKRSAGMFVHADNRCPLDSH